MNEKLTTEYKAIWIVQLQELPKTINYSFFIIAIHLLGFFALNNPIVVVNI
jgi:hypothetical protein